jgi:hypothetical protein
LSCTGYMPKYADLSGVQRSTSALTSFARASGCMQPLRVLAKRRPGMGAGRSVRRRSRAGGLEVGGFLENYFNNDAFLGDAVLVMFGGIEVTKLATASSSASLRLGRVRRPRRRRGYQLAKGTTHHAEKPHELSGPGTRGARLLGLGDFGPGFPCAVESFEFKEDFGRTVLDSRRDSGYVPPSAWYADRALGVRCGGRRLWIHDRKTFHPLRRKTA